MTGQQEKKLKKIFYFYNLNISKIDRVIKKHPADTLIHCASNNVVWDSKNNPQKYYKTNVSDTIDMLCKCVDLKIKISFMHQVLVSMETQK